MGYREVTVAPGVDLWRSTEAARPVRILPDGCVDLILIDGELLVAGPDAVGRVVPAGPDAVAVRIHGGRAPDLLGVAAHELTGRTVALAGLWGDRRASRLADRVQKDPLSLAGWALGAPADPFGLRLRSLLASGVRVADAARHLDLSARQLHRRTMTGFGYGPSRLSRILRLQRMLGLADAGRPWADCAALAGYADQAHLSRDVRELAGVTPTELRRERVRSVQDPAATPKPAWEA